MSGNFVEDKIIERIDAARCGVSEEMLDKTSNENRHYYPFYRFAIEEHFKLATRFPEGDLRLWARISTYTNLINLTRDNLDLFLQAVGRTEMELDHLQEEDVFDGGDFLGERYRELKHQISDYEHKKAEIKDCLLCRNFLRESRGLMTIYLSRWSAFRGEDKLDKAMCFINESFV